MSCLWVSSELRALKPSFKVPPVQVEDSEETKREFGLCLSGSGNKEVSGVVPLATTVHPTRKSGKFYEF